VDTLFHKLPMFIPKPIKIKSPYPYHAMLVYYDVQKSGVTITQKRRLVFHPNADDEIYLTPELIRKLVPILQAYARRKSNSKA